VYDEVLFYYSCTFAAPPKSSGNLIHMQVHKLFIRNMRTSFRQCAIVHSQNKKLIHPTNSHGGSAQLGEEERTAESAKRYYYI